MRKLGVLNRITQTELAVSNRRRTQLLFLMDNGIYVVTLLLFILFIFIAPYFFSSRNLVNILISASLAGIVTAGYTVAILAGQIETSTQGVLAVATVTTALLSVRVLTPVMFAASWVAARSAGLGLPLAVNRLARSSRTYRIPLLLLILTLALAVFSASLAQTMKRQLAEELFYRFGADMSLTELGETIEIDPLGTSSNSTESADSDTDQQQSASAAGYTPWSFLPVAQHRSAAGVQAVTRVGQYKALAHVARWKAEGRFFGIDRVDLPSVGFWRRDFAHRSLGDLMNALAITPNGVLVPSGFLRQMSLSQGDRLLVTVSIPEQRKELSWLDVPIEFEIVGAFNRFPAWPPHEGPLIAGNPDYLFEQAGEQYPFDVWLRTEPNPNYDQIEQNLLAQGFRILNWDAPGPRVGQALQ